MSTISHDGQVQSLELGKTIFDFADDLAVEVPTSCGRNGKCHECVVEIISGMEALNAASEPESFLRGNYRLACQAVVERTDTEIHFAPLRRQPRILTLGQNKTHLDLDPMVTRRGLDVLYDGKVIDQYRGYLYGLAVDLGTTTVVIDLVDLETGDSLDRLSFENPQRFGGSDVMHRISYDGGPHRGELQKAIVTAINRSIRNLSRARKFPRRAIYEIIVAGNSSMRDLLFGLDIQSIGQKPYKSSIEHEYLEGKRLSTELVENAWELGLRAHRETRLYGLPLIGSHVGADAAACLTAIDMASVEGEVVMMVDVGTNTEVVIGNAKRMVAASCPAGPAFEGGLVTYGMPAYDGAIESLKFCPESGDFDYVTVGGVPPEGLCGSGLVDLIAELRRHDRMTPKGVFQPDKRQNEITVVPENGITFSRADGSALAQATAANYCGQFIAMQNFGIDPESISKLYLAGGFANYVDVKNAIEIGFLAPVSVERIVKVGNAAIDGARELLLSRRQRKRLRALVKNIEHIELESTSDFFDIFVEGCQFTPMPSRICNVKSAST